jgi:hypothetical protein
VIGDNVEGSKAVGNRLGAERGVGLMSDELREESVSDEGVSDCGTSDGVERVDGSEIVRDAERVLSDKTGRNRSSVELSDESVSSGRDDESEW